MIDENNLNDMESLLNDTCRSPRTTASPAAYTNAGELIRLARLGLWAEKHGVVCVKAVKRARERKEAVDWDIFDEALAALPTQDESFTLPEDYL